MLWSFLLIIAKILRTKLWFHYVWSKFSSRYAVFSALLCSFIYQNERKITAGVHFREITRTRNGQFYRTISYRIGYNAWIRMLQWYEYTWCVQITSSSNIKIFYSNPSTVIIWYSTISVLNSVICSSTFPSRS